MSHYEELTVTEAFERDHGGLTADQIRTEIRVSGVADHIRHTAELLLETAEAQRLIAKEPFLSSHNVHAIRRIYDPRA
jgi:hypothetical protein